MRGFSIRGACRRRLVIAGVGVLAAWLILAAAAARADSADYAPADPQIPWPLGSTRPEDGGLYLGTQYTMFHWTNPLRSQPIANRGFYASDNSLGFPVGTHFGSGAPALNVNNLNGQGTWEPGFEIFAGWKFKDGSALTLSYTWFADAKYTNGATLNTLPGRQGVDLADTFISARVYNYPIEYNGPNNKVGNFNLPNLPQASPTAVSGIWNGASVMTILFTQRFQQVDATYRYPVIDDEDYRFNAIVGPRFAWIWERFLWRTTSYGIPDLTNPQIVAAGPQDVGIYTNIVSNRMYGVHAGCQTECYLGHGFAVLATADAAAFINGVKERAKYETGDKFLGLPESKRAKHEWSLVPELSGMLAIQWYPTEFVQIQLGYELMAFFNTLASTRPIDFNYLNVAPQYDHVDRLFQGLRVGIAFWF
jgi:hypothetical protein